MTIRSKIYLLRALMSEAGGQATVIWAYRTSKVRVVYDQEVDVLRILLSDATVEESDEDKPGVIIDYDGQGNIVGLEVLDASKRMENPRAWTTR